MKIGCFALVEPFTPLRRQFEIIAEMGVSYADLSDTHDGADLLAEFQHGAATSLDVHPSLIEEALEGTGVELTTVCAHSNLLDPPGPATYGTNQIIKAIKLAHFLGLPHVITTEGEPRHRFGKSLTGEQQIFSIHERLIQPVAWAKRLGVQLLLEPHGPVTCDMDATEELLRRLDEPEAVGLNLDTGNLWLGGSEPLEYIERFGPQIKHVHWKDYGPEWIPRRGQIFGSGKSTIALGDGEVGIAPVVRALKQIGFDGATTLEISGEQAIRTSVDRLREWSA